MKIAAISTTLKPKFIETMTVNTEPTTLAEALTAQAHGTKPGESLRSKLTPWANGMPSNTASGAVIAPETNALVVRSSAITDATIWSLNMTMATVTTAMPTGIMRAIITEPLNSGPEMKL